MRIEVRPYVPQESPPVRLAQALPDPCREWPQRIEYGLPAQATKCSLVDAATHGPGKATQRATRQVSIELLAQRKGQRAGRCCTMRMRQQAAAGDGVQRAPMAAAMKG